MLVSHLKNDGLKFDPLTFTNINESYSIISGIRYKKEVVQSRKSPISKTLIKYVEMLIPKHEGTHCLFILLGDISSYLTAGKLLDALGVECGNVKSVSLINVKVLIPNELMEFVTVSMTSESTMVCQQSFITHGITPIILHTGIPCDFGVFSISCYHSVDSNYYISKTQSGEIWSQMIPFSLTTYVWAFYDSVSNETLVVFEGGVIDDSEFNSKFLSKFKGKKTVVFSYSGHFYKKSSMSKETKRICNSLIRGIDETKSKRKLHYDVISASNLPLLVGALSRYINHPDYEDLFYDVMYTDKDKEYFQNYTENQIIPDINIDPPFLFKSIADALKAEDNRHQNGNDGLVEPTYMFDRFELAEYYKIISFSSAPDTGWLNIFIDFTMPGELECASVFGEKISGMVNSGYCCEIFKSSIRSRELNVVFGDVNQWLDEWNPGDIMGVDTGDDDPNKRVPCCEMNSVNKEEESITNISTKPSRFESQNSVIQKFMNSGGMLLTDRSIADNSHIEQIKQPHGETRPITNDMILRALESVDKFVSEKAEGDKVTKTYEHTEVDVVKPPADVTRSKKRVNPLNIIKTFRDNKRLTGSNVGKIDYSSASSALSCTDIQLTFDSLDVMDRFYDAVVAKHKWRK